MKQITLLVVAGVLIVCTATAQDDSQSQHKHQARHGQSMHGGMMMGMMDEEQMKKMHQHMQQMHATMQKIEQESDPKKRQQLVRQHREAMQKGMHMMGGGGMHAGMMGKDSQGKNQRI